MNYIKLKNNYISLDQVNFFRVDPRAYSIAFYCDYDNLLVVDFDTRDEYNSAVEKLELTIKGKGSLVK